MDPLEQNPRLSTAFERVPSEPRDDVGVGIAASGIQAAAGALRLRRPDFPLARTTGAGAFAAMLTERGDTENVDHQRAARIADASIKRQAPPARNMAAGEKSSPG
jgi:hypothetical protein